MKEPCRVVLTKLVYETTEFVSEAQDGPAVLFWSREAVFVT